MSEPRLAQAMLRGLVPKPDTLKVMVVAALFGAGANALGIPAGWLSGAMIGAFIASQMTGWSCEVPRGLVFIDFVLMGILSGSGVTPETVPMMMRWPGPIVGMMICVITIVVCGSAYLRHIEGWDRTTAFFATLPGALSSILAFAIDMKADVRTIAFAQIIRLVVLIALLPLPFAFAPPAVLPPALTDQITAHPWWELALLVAAAIACAGLLHWVRFPGAAIVGAMLASAVLHGAGMVHGRLPNWSLAFGMVVLGTLLASRLSGVTMAELRRLARATHGALMVATVISALFAIIVAKLSGLGFAVMLLAYAPGGLEAMTMLAYALGYDPAFVGTLHITRFLFIALGLPLAVRFTLGYRRGTEDGP